MNSLVSISEASSLALHGMGLIACKESQMTVREMASMVEVSEAHLAKVFQRLSKAGLVVSSRGPGGGFMLSRDASSISLYDIYRAIEGDPSISSCLLASSSCPFRGCIFGSLLKEMSEKFIDHLKGNTLEDLSRGEVS